MGGCGNRLFALDGHRGNIGGAASLHWGCFQGLLGGHSQSRPGFSLLDGQQESAKSRLPRRYGSISTSAQTHEIHPDDASGVKSLSSGRPGLREVLLLPRSLIRSNVPLHLPRRFRRVRVLPTHRARRRHVSPRRLSSNDGRVRHQTAADEVFE